MAIEGELRSVTLADISQLLSMGRKTGCLTVTHRTNFGYIYLADGRVIYATVLNRPDRLGELLVRNGVISRETLEGAMRTQSQHPGKRLGQILIESGSLSEAELRHYVTNQIEEAVYHLLAWEEGSFHFEPDRRPEADGVLLVSLVVENLLLEGARRVDELSLIEKRIPSRDLIFAIERRPEPGDEVQLTPAQAKLVELLDGVRSVDEVIEESGLGEFDALKGIFALLQAGFARPAGRRESEDLEEARDAAEKRLNLGNAFYRAGMLEEAEREYEAALEADPRHPDARTRLGTIALRAGRAEDALRHFEALAEAEPGAERVSTLLNQGYALELLGRYGEALAALDRAAALAPSDPRIPLARGIALLKDGKGAAAREAFTAHRGALGPEGSPGPIYFAYALLASLAAGEMEEAVRIGREGLTLHPTSAPILVHLGVVLERKGDTGAAEALYLRAVTQNPPSPAAHRNLGELAHHRGDSAGARAHYERALKLDPELGDDLHLKLGNLAYEEGDRASARAHWERALALDPENQTVRANLELIASGSAR